MDFDDFVRKEKENLEELVNWIVMSPTEETLRECVKAISFRILLHYPNINLNLVTNFSLFIVEEYLLPMVQQKQNNIINVMGLNNGYTNNSNILYPTTKSHTLKEDVYSLIGGIFSGIFGVSFLYGGLFDTLGVIGIIGGLFFLIAALAGISSFFEK